MIDCNVLTELKARKAKFGFKYDGVRTSAFIPLGKLMDALYNNYTDADFDTEMTGMHHNDFRLYTNSEDVSNFIRVNFCIKP